MNLARRIKFVMEKTGLSLEKFSESIGEKPTRITDIIREKQRVPSEILEKVVDKYNVDAYWLLTGKNPENKKLEIVQKKSTEISNYSNFEEEFALVRAFDDITASAGFGSINSDYIESTKYLAFRRRWLTYHQYNPDKLIAIWAKGDSMEPTIPNHTCILLNTAQKKPIDGGIFVVRREDTLWVKRIQIQLNGDLLLISDNSAYPPIVLEERFFDQVDIIGQIVYLGMDI